MQVPSGERLEGELGRGGSAAGGARPFRQRGARRPALLYAGPPPASRPVMVEGLTPCRATRPVSASRGEQGELGERESAKCRPGSVAGSPGDVAASAPGLPLLAFGGLGAPSPNNCAGRPFSPHPVPGFPESEPGPSGQCPRRGVIPPEVVTGALAGRRLTDAPAPRPRPQGV